METGILLIKMDIENFTLVNLEILSLREVIWIILWHSYLEIDWRWESVPKEMSWLLTSLRWYVQGMSLNLLNHTSRYCCKNSSEKLQQGYVIIAQEWKLPSKEQLQTQSAETSFCICLWSNNQVLPKFYYLLIFSPSFN